MPLPGRVRSQVCAACWRRCAYDDFRDKVPVTSEPRRGHDRRSFAEVSADLHVQLKERIAAGGIGGARRRTVLGKMHQEKQALWDKLTAECFHRGEALPRTTEEALLWASSLGARRFREEVLHLGMGVVRARRGTPLTVREFLEWWQRVGAQRDLPLLQFLEGAEPVDVAPPEGGWPEDIPF